MLPLGRLIDVLSDGHFHSGEQLGQTFGVSRASVWKAMRSLSRLGLELQAVRGRGYRLASPVERLDRGRILTHIGRVSRGLLADLEIHQDIGSTNSHLLERTGTETPSGQVCLAERQQAGRGRRGRNWVSPFGAAVYCSASWRFDAGPALLSGLSLAVGVAVADALAGVGAEGVGLKWPNDIVWRERKLAGVLIEMSGEAGGPCRVVAGIGVNVRMPGSCALDIDQPWTDLDAVLGTGVASRNRVAGLLLDRLLPALALFERTGLAPFLNDWARRDVCRGRRVWLQTPAGGVVGEARGVDERGALIVADNGRERRFDSAEVSLRSA